MTVSPHLVWALFGFFVGMGFLWIYHILRTRGFRFFWIHPLLAGVLAIFLLYVLDNVLDLISGVGIQLSWGLMLLLGVPLAILTGLFFYRAVTTPSGRPDKDA